MSNLLPGYSWDTTSSRYRNAQTGRFVARREITGLLEQRIQDGQTRLSEMTTAFHEGRLSASVWTEQMRTELRRMHSQQRALGAGGWDQMTQSDWGAVGGKLRADYERVTRFAQEIQDGSVSLPQALNRVDGYVGNSRIQFWNAQSARAATGTPGMIPIERRRLGEAEHCDDCVGYYNQGWQRAGTLPAPGEASVCTVHCRCTKDSREVPAGEIDEWIGTKR